VLVQVLIKLGYPLESVDRAENGQIAVDKTLAHSYDVILMDVRRVMRGPADARRSRCAGSSETGLICADAGDGRS